MRKKVQKKYYVSWGMSVYYPHQPAHTNRRCFSTKKLANAFLKKVNKRKTTEFSDAGVMPNCKPKRAKKLTMY